ncbi:MAG: rRNA pseudouridine synthase [Ferrovum sp.]|nr:rRNA pseudouridine synthase [Ferrovum sp.]NDU87507.1 rRNA pseudouridine synthase [Ferrovum sp.]
MTDMERISKVMASRGLCSRREADEWIERGWVQVDGVTVTQLGSKMAPQQTLTIASAARKSQGRQVTLLLHKPIGVVSSQAEEGYRPALDLITPETRWSEDGMPLKWSRQMFQGMATAGRLDIDSTGLLVFTQDGRVAKTLIGPESTVEKEYLVRVEGGLSAQNLARLNHGLSLDGRLLRPARVHWQNRDQLRFVLQEGRKRQIRRMCELVGLRVVGLKRVRIGGVTLGHLPLGQWRFLATDETF